MTFILVVVVSVKEAVEITTVELKEEVKLIVEGVTVDNVLVDSFTVGNGAILDDNSTLVEVGSVETALALTVLETTILDSVILKECVRFALVVAVKLISLKEMVDTTALKEGVVMLEVESAVDIILVDKFTGVVDSVVIPDDGVTLKEVGVISNVETVLALTVLGVTTVVSAILKDCVRFTLVVVVKLPSELEAEELRDEVKLMVEGVTVSVDNVLVDSFKEGVGDGSMLDDNGTLVEVGNVVTVLTLTVLVATKVLSAVLKDRVRFTLAVVIKPTVVLLLMATSDVDKLVLEVSITAVDDSIGGLVKGNTDDDVAIGVLTVGVTSLSLLVLKNPLPSRLEVSKVDV